MVASTAEDAAATIHYDSAKLVEEAEEYAVHHHRTACHSPAKAEAHAEKEEDRAGRNAVVEDVDADDAGNAENIDDDARHAVAAEDSASSFHRTAAAVVAGTGSEKRVGSPVRHRAASDDTDAVIRASSCGEMAVVVGNGAAASRLVWVWRVVGASLRRFFGRTTLLNPQLRWKRPS